jgi:hypothetical protein
MTSFKGSDESYMSQFEVFLQFSSGVTPQTRHFAAALRAVCCQTPGQVTFSVQSAKGTGLACERRVTHTRAFRFFKILITCCFGLCYAVILSAS